MRSDHCPTRPHPYVRIDADFTFAPLLSACLSEYFPDLFVILSNYFQKNLRNQIIAYTFAIK